MLTRSRQRVLDHPACNAVFNTPELLETILSFLNQNENGRDILHILRAQRVCRRWKDTISGSPALQRLLFFQPDEKACEKRLYNPVLIDIFGGHVIDFGYKQFVRLPIAKDEARRAAFMEPTASWRRMLPTQPPMHKLGCWMATYPVYVEVPGDDWWEFRILYFPQGLRLATLYDRIQRWLWQSKDAAPRCRLNWTPRDQKPPQILEFHRTEERQRANEKCYAACDIVLEGNRWFGKEGPGRQGRGGLTLKRLKGEEILGPASNYEKANKYKTAVQFAKDLDAEERAKGGTENPNVHIPLSTR